MLKDVLLLIFCLFNILIILTYLNPGCFWVTMKGCGPHVVEEIEYEKLNAEMNQFYDKAYEDEVKPITLEKNQLCVVFSEELKCWCRAVVKSIMYCADYYQIECFLVDYAKYTFVKSKDVRVAMEKFTQIPFRAKKCRLYCTKPVTLRVNFCEDTAKIVPAKRWDNAATWYFQSLLKATTQIKAKLCSVEGDIFHVILYVTVEDEKVGYFYICKPVGTQIIILQFLRLKSITNEFCPMSDTVSAVLFIKGVSVMLKIEVILFQNLSEERSFVFLSNKIEPTPVLEKAPLHDSLKKVTPTFDFYAEFLLTSELAQDMFLGPNFTESYCWPAVARGCDVVAISYQGNDPFIYIPPVLTILQVESCYKALPKRNGPLVLILCPGWRKAQLVFELLKKYSRCSRMLHPVLIILGNNKEEAETAKIQGCEIIVTTPYSLLRLYEYHILMFSGLSHLILDEMEVLFSEAAEQVFVILNYYKKGRITEEWKYPPRQIIAVGTRWNKHVGSLIKEFMNDPYIVITALEEASIFGNVQQVVQHCVSSERIAVLLKMMDFTPNNLQKVLVFTNSIDEVEIVHKVKTKSVIMLTETSECHTVGILRYLEHAEADIPPGLAGVLEAEEKKKFARPLCTYLKMFGTCKNRTVCPDRHQINLQVDMLQNMPSKPIQTSGYVTVLPLHIVNATNYFGRIVDKHEDQYTILAEEINEYFKETSNRVAVQKVEKLALYGFCEETVFHRVQVVETSSKEEENFNIKIEYIDEGRTSQVQSSQLLHLPARFQHLPPQAVEFVVCRVKPIDNDTEWNPRVTHRIRKKIERKPHEAKVVLTLGNTVWIDPMVRVTRLSDLKMYVNEYSVRSEILSTGLGTDNPEHILQLQKLCEHMKTTIWLVGFCVEMHLEVFLFSVFGLTPIKLYYSFYPEIKWFENEEAVTVKVQIARIDDYKCEFLKEKVIFSACSEGKFYLADMELCQCILTEKSMCVIKDKEAVIVLRKEKRGAWCKLLKNKNPHVSFDFEYWEDFEDKSPFPVGTKKLHCAAAEMEELADSSEDSDAESDE
uniref:RNA helicase n=1 Tax=Coturnix japonica TaxID=93934 RepID=A0A8C2TU52_COTJA